eukprot:6396281-Lingulodinium_polyedra.AAC.2
MLLDEDLGARLASASACASPASSVPVPQQQPPAGGPSEAATAYGARLRPFRASRLGTAVPYARSETADEGTPAADGASTCGSAWASPAAAPAPRGAPRTEEAG